MEQILKETIVIGSLTLPFTLMEFLLHFLLPVFIILCASWLLSFIIGRIVRKNSTNEEKSRKALRIIRRVIKILVFLGILLFVGIFLGAEEVLKGLGKVLSTPFFKSGTTQISALTLLFLIPVFLVTSWIGHLVKNNLEGWFTRRTALGEDKAFIFSRLVRYLVMVLVFIIGLSVIGINLSALGLLLGVLGIGIGFGLQGFVADFFAGVTLLGMGLLKEGDRIKIQGHDGIIQRMRLLNTEMINFQNETLIIPNSKFTQDVIHNYSYKDRRVVIINEVGVAYDCELPKALELLEDVAARNPWLSREDPILTRVKAFGDSSIELQLRTWITDLKNTADAVSWINLEIWRCFRDQGIEIPFPQRVVTLHKEAEKKQD